MATNADEMDLSLASEFAPAGREDWLREVDAVLKGRDFDKVLGSRTDDGLAIAPLYGADGAAGPILGRPQGVAWEVCQLFANPDPDAVNEAILRDLAGGVGAVLLALEAPGQSGIAIDNAGDLARTLAGVDLAAAPVRLRPGARYREAGEWLTTVWRDARAEPGSIRGAVNADPAGTLAQTGALPVSVDDALNEAATLAKTMGPEFPAATALCADGRIYHEAGASEAQELACALATAASYLRAQDKAGIEPQAGLRQIAMCLAADADQFLTMAKFRAARAVWTHMVEACGVEASKAPLTLHAETSARMLTRRDPWVNMLRVCVACFAAGTGGADIVTARPFTAAIGLPDRLARRIARNTQTILQAESSLTQVTDPSRGAGYVMTLSDDLAGAAWAMFQEIEKQGGIIEALSKGTIQSQIKETAEARDSAIAKRRISITGVNEYPNLAETPPQVAPRRDAPAPDGVATIEPLPPRALSEPFDRLRDASDAKLASDGSRPGVFLANLGTPADFTARASFAQNLFAAGGIEAIAGEGTDRADAVAEAFKASGAAIVCLCSSDDIYRDFAVETARALADAGAKHIYLAGHPGEQREVYEKAGIGTFIHMGCDVLEVLEAAHDKLGIAS